MLTLWRRFGWAKEERPMDRLTRVVKEMILATPHPMHGRIDINMLDGSVGRSLLFANVASYPIDVTRFVHEVLTQESFVVDYVFNMLVSNSILATDPLTHTELRQQRVRILQQLSCRVNVFATTARMYQYQPSHCTQCALLSRLNKMDVDESVTLLLANMGLFLVDVHPRERRFEPTPREWTFDPETDENWGEKPSLVDHARVLAPLVQPFFIQLSQRLTRTTHLLPDLARIVARYAICIPL